VSDESVTIDDLREGEDHDEDESDLDVVYNEFEAIIGGVKAAMFALQSKRDVGAAVDELRETIMRATDLQSAVLSYMAAEDADAEEEAEGDEDEDEDEDEEDEEEEAEGGDEGGTPATGG